MTPTAQVVVVSRSAAARRLLCLLLRREGFSCAEAADGDAAFELLEDDGPAALLMDLRAPEEEDVVFIGLLRRRRPDLGTLVLHAGGARVNYGETEHVLSSDAEGCDLGPAFPALKDLTRAVAWLLAEDQMARLRPATARA